MTSLQTSFQFKLYHAHRFSVNSYAAPLPVFPVCSVAFCCSCWFHFQYTVPLGLVIVCARDIAKQTLSKIIYPNTNIFRETGGLLKITLALVQSLLMLQHLETFLKINCMMFFYSMQKVPYLKDYTSQLST